jgi:hypothetical protein
VLAREKDAQRRAIAGDLIAIGQAQGQIAQSFQSSSKTE